MAIIQSLFHNPLLNRTKIITIFISIHNLINPKSEESFPSRKSAIFHICANYYAHLSTFFFINSSPRARKFPPRNHPPYFISHFNPEPEANTASRLLESFAALIRRMRPLLPRGSVSAPLHPDLLLPNHPNPPPTCLRALDEYTSFLFLSSFLRKGVWTRGVGRPWYVC